MYSDFKSVQLIVALLKKHNINQVVVSPGGGSIPIIHSIETDPFFTCYSVVDERSALYFGIGISQIKNVPVACVCTSGTSVCNFLPGMTEAYYQSVPIVAITADKNPHFTNNLETQKIDQRNIFGPVCRKSVDLPIINTEEDQWYCGRLINEALIEVNHHGCGPVHINIPIVGNTEAFNCKELPDVKKISYVTRADNDLVWHSYIEKLSEAKRILIVVGQNIVFSADDQKYIEKFHEKYNCVISVEHLSNIKCNGCVMTYSISEMCNDEVLNRLVPDLVISLGNNIASSKLKIFLRHNKNNFTHWEIDEAGRVRDTFKALSEIFESTPSYFFSYFSEHAPRENHNNKEYYNAWLKVKEEIVIPEFEFSNFYVAKLLSKYMPVDSIMHLAILNSSRIMQFFDLDPSIKVYSNIGALGIDGCLSTFIGQAAVVEKMAFCVIGDLSFFYDMNAAGIRYLGNNIRIVLLNNGGGSEFHYNTGKKYIPTINKHICAEHSKIGQGWIESLGYKYYSASSKDELDSIIVEFTSESDGPMFLEVYTDMEKDADLTNKFYNLNRNKDASMKSKFKSIVGSVLNDSQKAMVKKTLSKFTD